MATLDYALTTEARIKTRLTITVSGFDTMLKRMMYAATDFIEKECGGRRFKRTTYTQELYNGTPLGDDSGVSVPFLILRNSPVSTLTTLEYRTGSRSSPTWVAFQTDDYEPDNSNGIVRVWGGLPKGMQNIRATYAAGYLIDFTQEFDDAAHTLPNELTDLCERLVIKLFKKREKEGVSQENFAETGLTWKEFLDEGDKATLNHYARPVFV